VVPSRVRPLAAVLLLTLALPARTAAPQPADTTRVSHDPLFTRRDALVAGAFVLGTVALYPADRAFARRIRIDRLQDNRLLHESAEFFNFMGTPGPLYIGASMYAVGRLTRVERMADLGLHGTEAVYLARTAVTLVKGLAGRARPQMNIEDPSNFGFARGYRSGSDRYRSFPSGHTTMAFAAASAVTAETSRWWPSSVWYVAPIMYGGATLVGVTRMYDNRHWASDVIMGAAIGTFSGLKVVKYHHSHPNNRLDRWLLMDLIAPDGDGGVLVAFSLVPPRH
jgi:hypothetical protein